MFETLRLLEIFTTRIFYLKLKENNENEIDAQAFWAFFCSRRLTAENNSAAVPAPIFFLPDVIQAVHC
jgi:hypothetical protein